MQIKFRFFTKNNFDKSLTDFLKKGIEGTLKLEKYDFKEPLKQSLDSNSTDEVIQMLSNKGNLILKGKNKCSISCWRYAEGFTSFTCNLVLNEKSKKNIPEIISLLEIFAKHSNIIYGCIATEEEYDLKHKVTTEYSYGMEGVSRFDFAKFLPGVYWYTIFGKELVNAIGEEKLKNLPSVIYTEPKNGCIAFHLDEAIESDNSEFRIQKEKQIASIIGEYYFFDRNKDVNTLSHPKQFLGFLKSLEK